MSSLDTRRKNEFKSKIYFFDVALTTLTGIPVSSTLMPDSQEYLRQQRFLLASSYGIQFREGRRKCTTRHLRTVLPTSVIERHDAVRKERWRRKCGFLSFFIPERVLSSPSHQRLRHFSLLLLLYFVLVCWCLEHCKQMFTVRVVFMYDHSPSDDNWSNRRLTCLDSAN